MKQVALWVAAILGGTVLVLAGLLYLGVRTGQVETAMLPEGERGFGVNSGWTFYAPSSSVEWTAYRLGFFGVSVRTP
jgi:hypothetical protein